jgi:hypothetical protein
MQFNSIIRKNKVIASDKLATLKHVSQIQEDHLEHLKNLTQNELLRWETINKILISTKQMPAQKVLFYLFFETSKNIFINNFLTSSIGPPVQYFPIFFQ